MKHKLLVAGAMTLMMAAATSPSIADEAYASLYGEAVQSSAASRTITIDHDTQYVNVTGGDVVKFVTRNKTFAWSFDTANTISEIDLNKIAPADALHHMVKVYVARDPTYLGGS